MRQRKIISSLRTPGRSARWAKRWSKLCGMEHTPLPREYHTEQVRAIKHRHGKGELNMRHQVTRFMARAR